MNTPELSNSVSGTSGAADFLCPLCYFQYPTEVIGGVMVIRRQPAVVSFVWVFGA
jgi:hypothetical protein